LSGAGERGRWAALTAVNLAAVIFGSAALFGRLDVSPAWIVAGRTAFAAAALVITARFVGASMTAPRERLPALAGTAVLLAAHWITFFAAVQAGGVAIATLTVSSFPLFTLLIEAARAQRRPRAVELASGAAIVVAVALLVRPSPQAAASVLAGAGYGLASAVLFAVFSLASQRLVEALGPLRMSLWQYGLVALMIAPALPFTRGPSGWTAWSALAALGVVGTALAHQLYLVGLRRLPAAVCGGLVTLEPVYAILLAALLFDEPVGLAVAASAVLIIGASLALLRSR
jgi:drug/metabolite transporter (DMT)-like permease